MKKLKLIALTGALSLALNSNGFAQENIHNTHDMKNANNAIHNDHKAHTLAPISIMGAHRHSKNEWMLSYRHKQMEMSGNRIGKNDISPENIVTTIANANPPPATLRIVPQSMNMDMHMFSAMYGLTDWLTLMGMGMYVKKEMKNTTFSGMAGTTQRGEFTARASGWGDTKISALLRLYEGRNTSAHINLGLSIPTGSIKESDDVFAPNGTRPTLRLPYAMQLGSGTWDALPGLTYSGHKNDWSWGTQYTAKIRLGNKNNQGYRLGNKHEIKAWGSYQFTPWLQGNMTLSAETMGEIKGTDILISAPIQTANPKNYGGDIAQTSLGVNITPTHKAFTDHQIGLEATLPVYQDFNGLQLKRDFGITAAWIYRF